MVVKSSSRKVRFTDKLSLGVLTRVFHRDLVDEVVEESGRRERRSRLLPARVVVYFVMALGLFFGESYDEVIRKMTGGLRFLRSWGKGWSVPTASALTQARQRLGEAPLKALFERVAVPFATPGTRGAWFGDWRVMAVDGVVLDAPDTPSNDAEFGRYDSGRDAAAFTQPRVVALIECGTRAVVAAAIGAASDGERQLLSEFINDIEPGMLVLGDRGFPSYELWHQLVQRGAATLFRVSSRWVLPVLTPLPDGSYLSVVLPKARQSPIRKGARRHAKGDLAAEYRFLGEHGTRCRVIEYQLTGSDETYRLITSLTDPDEAPAAELAALYRERWEIEILFDEIEIHQMGNGRVLRSQSAAMVKQEIWGLLLTHYAIRHFMHEAAETGDIDADRLSFLTALRITRHHLIGRVDFSPQE